MDSILDLECIIAKMLKDLPIQLCQLCCINSMSSEECLGQNQALLITTQGIPDKGRENKALVVYKVGI